MLLFDYELFRHTHTRAFLSRLLPDAESGEFGRAGGRALALWSEVTTTDGYWRLTADFDVCDRLISLELARPVFPDEGRPAFVGIMEDISRDHGPGMVSLESTEDDEEATWKTADGRLIFVKYRPAVEPRDNGLLRLTVLMRDGARRLGRPRGPGLAHRAARLVGLIHNLRPSPLVGITPPNIDARGG